MALRLLNTVPWISATLFFGAVACGGSNDPGGDGDGDGDSATGGAVGDGDTGGLTGSGGFVEGSGGTGEGAGGDPSTGGSSTGGVDGSGGDAMSGGAPNTGGDSGTGGAPPEPTYALTETGGVYTYAVGDSSMTIDPSDGGRVTSFVVAQNETLVQENDASQYGSVFWPSPQSLFPGSWPPPPEIDSGTYTVEVSDDQLTLTSAPAASVGLTIKKVFTPTHSASGHPAISVAYTMTNTSASAVGVSGWEISRVGPGGMAFFPTGPGGELAASTLSGTVMGAHTWYPYDATGLTGVPKIFADGSDGWLAWSTGEAIVIKSFPDVPTANFAPSEAEIEIYADPSGTYFEVEQQGPLENIVAGGSATWTVLWIGVAIPDGASTAVGSADLTTLVTTAL